MCFLSRWNKCIASELTHRLKCHNKLSLRKCWILQCFRKRIEQAFSVRLPFFDHNEDKVFLWQLRYNLSFWGPVLVSTMKLIIQYMQKRKIRSLTGKKKVPYICEAYVDKNSINLLLITNRQASAFFVCTTGKTLLYARFLLMS